jgi:uncharacterized YccA/Bax inhibitor family protein
MALFQSGNPTLSEKIFDKTLSDHSAGTMTVRGAMNKFGFLLLMVIAGAVFTWNMYELKPFTMMTFMWVGMIGGLITAFAICFKPNWAPFLAPAYGVLEGLFLGAISVVINNAVSAKNPVYSGIVMQAVGLTFGVALAMFLLYNFRVIKVTQKLRTIIFTATAGIAIFYLITLVLNLFHVNTPFMQDASPLGIGISLFVIAIAALNLLLDFDMIEKGADAGAPKYMEWYGAFGLMVTIVWLYIEILKLLTRFASNRN